MYIHVKICQTKLPYFTLISNSLRPNWKYNWIVFCSKSPSICMILGEFWMWILGFLAWMVLFPWTISIRILLSNVYGASLTKGKDSRFKWDINHLTLSSGHQKAERLIFTKGKDHYFKWDNQINLTLSLGKT